MMAFPAVPFKRQRMVLKGFASQAVDTTTARANDVGETQGLKFMILLETAFVIWAFNCLVAAAIADFFGWTAGVCAVMLPWLLLGMLMAVASFIDTSSRESSPTERRVDMFAAAQLLAFVLAWPAAYAVVRYAGSRARAASGKALEASE